MFGAGARSSWIPGAVGLVSQAVIFAAWGDAWADTVANVLLLLIVAFGWLTEGPRSFHAQYLRDAQAGLARVVATPIVTDQIWFGFPSQSSDICASREVWDSRACRVITFASEAGYGARPIPDGCHSRPSN